MHLNPILVWESYTSDSIRMHQHRDIEANHHLVVPNLSEAQRTTSIYTSQSGSNSVSFFCWL